MRVLAALFALGLTACGLREPLEPPPGQSLPVAPAAVREPPTAEQLLAQPTIARPARVDELLRRSEEREDDRFDLPPAEIPGGEVPVREPEGEGPEWFQAMNGCNVPRTLQPCRGHGVPVRA